MTSFLKKLIYKPFTISVKYTLRRYERVFKRNYIVSDYNLLLQVKSTDISTYDFFTIAKYQDENDFLIKHIRILFLLYYYGIRVLRLFFRKENTESTKVKKLGNSSYIVLSKYKKNDWVYFFTDNISYDYMISLKIIFHSSFKEFQIAFKHRSIFERLRFRIIDNNRLVFEVVAKGVFFNELKVLPFSLDMNRKYDIDVVLQGHDHTYSRSKILYGDGKTHGSYEFRLDETGLDYDWDHAYNKNTGDSITLNPLSSDTAAVEAKDAFTADNKCYTIESSGKSVVTNPKGTLYMTANSASGSKYYELINSQQDYIEVRSQNWLPSYSVINLTKDDFKITTYQITDEGKVENIDNTFTIHKTVSR